jgi:hypothetical protein
MTRAINILATAGGLMFVGILAYEAVEGWGIWRQMKRDRCG